MSGFNEHISEARLYLSSAENGSMPEVAAGIAQVHATMALAHAVQDVVAVLRGETPGVFQA